MKKSFLNNNYFLTISFFIITTATLYISVTGPELETLSEIINAFKNQTNLKDIILNLRLPRLAAALITGGGLAAAGVIFQALLRNPLADPYTAGISGGAALGASLAVLFKLSSNAAAFGAFSGSLLSLIVVLIIRKRFSLYSQSLILAGIAISMISSSSVMFIYAISESRDVHKAMLWLAGDLSIARYSILAPSSIIIIILFLISICFSNKLDIISLGENYAHNLGISEVNIRNLFIIASMITAVTVLLSGIITFVGLMIPHIIRRITGPTHKPLLLLSFLTGGVFLALCDNIGKIAAYPFEVPAGIFTGIIGGLFFLLTALRVKS